MQTISSPKLLLEAPDNSDAQKSAGKTGAIRVYLTDDDQQFSVAVGDLLQDQAGIELIGSANSIEKTLSDLASHPIDVLVLDLYMPEGESLEAMTDLRHLVPSIKVLVITGGGWTDQQVASILAGANGFLYKPFTSSDLANSIRIVHSGKAFFDFTAVTRALTVPNVLPAVPHDSLSTEDREFLELIRQGMSCTQIAAKWSIGVKAVYQRRYRLKSKLKLHSARDLECLAAAASNGTSPPSPSS